MYTTFVEDYLSATYAVATAMSTASMTVTNNNYRLGTVNSNTVNPKFLLNQARHMICAREADLQ